jgi:hypothetical protein
MHKVNAGFTVLARLDASHVDAKRARLAELDAHPDQLPFASSTTTHFATITVIPEQVYGNQALPPTLLFATSFCGPTRVHVRELVAVMGDGLRDVFAHCEGFDAACGDADLERFLLDHRVGDTFYSAMPDLSPEDVRRHQQLRDAIEEFIDKRQASGGLTGTALAARREIQEFVIMRDDLAWAQKPFAPPWRSWWIFHRRSLIVEAGVAALVLCTLARIVFDSAVLTAAIVVGWAALIAFVLFVVALVLSVREGEAEQGFVSVRQSDDYVRDRAATQNRPVINQFTLAGPIKDEGVLRPEFLRLSLWIVARVVEGVPFIPYIGSGIDIPTVATARWIPTDGGRRLMFISNYTNDGVPYVRDFIETRGGAMRINLSFGFGRGFPKTRWVIYDGALTDPNAYLYALADHQQRETLFWYCPYRNISIDNIKLNRDIREGLFGRCTEEQAQKWLHLL